MTEKKIAEFRIGDLVRRHQVGEPAQMFMFDMRNLGIVVEVHGEKAPGVTVYWQLSKRASYYSVYAAEKTLQLISRANKDDNENKL